ncbi:MAG: hypothetical protein ACI4WH_04485 [Oscillospiraceae bacterium]
MVKMVNILNQISELFNNVELFADLCSKVDLSKDVKVLTNYNDFHVQGYMFEWFEMNITDDMNIQEVFCHLFVRSIYFTEEYSLDDKFSYSNWLEFIQSYLIQDSMGKHNIVLSLDNSKFWNEIYIYLPQVLGLKKCIHNHHFRKNFKKVLIHNVDYNSFIDAYKSYGIIQLFDEYMGAIYFGTNGNTAFYCDMEFTD